MSDTAGAGAPAAAAPAGNSVSNQSAAENTAQGASQTQQTAATQPTKTELKELAAENMDQIVTMKVDGKPVRMTVKDALKQAELASGAQRRMQEAAEMRKQYQKFLQNEDEYFKARGIDPDQYATERLVKKYERMAMTPEQKKNLETSERLQHYEAREQQQRSQIINQIKNLADGLPEQYLQALNQASPEQLQGELKMATARYQNSMQTLEKEFIDAWQESGLPKDTVFGTWLASLMHASQVQKNQGQREQALSTREAAAIVKDNFLSAVGRITGNMDAESIHRLLGPETMKKLREYDIQRVTGKGPEYVDQNAPARPASLKKNSKHVNEHGWKAAWSKLGV